MFDKKHPNEIPLHIEKKIHLVYGTSAWERGELLIRDYEGGTGVYLASKMISFDLPADTPLLAQQGIIHDLREEKNEILAEAEVKANKIQDQINSYLAIAYQPVDTEV